MATLWVTIGWHALLNRASICWIVHSTITIKQLHLKLFKIKSYTNTRRVWRYQRGNQNPYIEEEQTT